MSRFAPPGVGWFDMDGNEITVEQWGALFNDLPGRTLHRTRVPMPDGVTAEAVTMWLGMVDPSTCCTRLFGSAVSYDDTGMKQVKVYDTKGQADSGHHIIVALLRGGHRPQSEH